MQKVVVIGSGSMGQGIAQWFAQQNVQVYLVDTNRDLLQKNLQKIQQVWETLLQKKKISEEDRNTYIKNIQIGLLTDLELEVKEKRFLPDLVIEAIFENLAIKIELFQNLQRFMPTQALFASNTSSLLIKDMQKTLPIDRQKNFLGIHFFNPAPLMKLVELVEGPESKKGSAPTLAEWFRRKGKIAVICRDSPGFIVNRLARHYYGEALRLAEEKIIQGSLDSEVYGQIDQTLTECYGFKMGPFTLMDLIGIDVNLDVSRSVWQAFNQAPRFAPHSIQEKKVANKEWGKKSQKGFYRYES